MTVRSTPADEPGGHCKICSCFSHENSTIWRPRSRLVRREALRSAGGDPQRGAALGLHAQSRATGGRDKVRRQAQLSPTTMRCSPIPSWKRVSITTMWDQHAAPTIAALRAGKHVFLEKPMASDARRLRPDRQRRQRGADSYFMVGHICRFNPALCRRQTGDRGGQDRQNLVHGCPPQPARANRRRGARQDRPDHRRLRARHRLDVLVQRLARRLGLRANGEVPQPRASGSWPGDVSPGERRSRASWNRSGACRTPRPFRSTSGSKSWAPRVRSPSTTRTRIS